jgi:hypothetical protein
MRTLLACTLLAAAPLAWGESMRCNERIVSTEQLAGEVLAACGTPAYRDRWYAAPASGLDEELWFYNFGSQQLVKVLRFRQGRLVSIASDGYGFDSPPASSCAPTDIVRGLSAFRLLHRCGEPATRESFDELRTMHPDDPAARAGAWRPSHRERWVYDFGAGARMRIVTLREGRVTEVETGEAGSRGRND